MNIGMSRRRKKIKTEFKRKNTVSTQNILDRAKRGVKGEKWLYNGDEVSYAQAIEMALKNRPIHFLKKIKKKRPRILILGPGKGKEATGLYERLSSFGMKPQIDVFGLTKTIDPRFLGKEIKNDFSSNVSFEQISRAEHPKLVKALKDKYDSVISVKSVGYHTKYPEYSVFTTASTLKKGGRAFLEINKKIRDFRNLKKIDFERIESKSGDRRKEVFLKRLLNINNEKEKEEFVKTIFRTFIKNSQRFLQKEYPKRKYDLKILEKSKDFSLRFFNMDPSLGEKYAYSETNFVIEITRIK